MTELKKVLEPGLIKNVRIKNRISMAPMERCYADMDAYQRFSYGILITWLKEPKMA